MQTTTRQDTPARRRVAMERAIAEGIECRQLADSGQWIATSGTDETVAYPVTLRSCACPAGEHDDPICKHRMKLRATLAEQAIAAVESYGWACTETAVDLAVRALVWLEAAGVVASAIACPECHGGDLHCRMCGGEGQVEQGREPEARCDECGGDGYVKMSTGGHFSDWIAAPCPVCQPARKVA